MQQADIIALVASYVYVFAVILVGEALGRVVFHGSSSFSRKFVHIGVGMWVLGTVALFKSWQMAVIPPLTFILVNYISYRRDIFKGMESKDKRNLGTVYFPISFALIIAAFWTKPAVVVAGMMPMVWGDALAAIVGERWGKHRNFLFADAKSREGSAAMFLASFASVLIVLLAAGIAGTTALYASLLVALVAMIVEALTPWGIDNLTVPLLSALLLWFLV